jgi:putative DNA primase/helicase
MTSDPFAPIAATRKITIAKPDSESIIVMPVPADAPSPPAQHPKLGIPSAKHIYTDAGGAVLGYMWRFDVDGGKEFRPLTLWGAGDGRKSEWRWEAWPSPRPLYCLHQLALRPLAPVVVCEGEKAVDAAARLLSDFVTVTSPNGSKSAGKADWSVLKGRSVLVWPDADEAGVAYAQRVAEFAAAAGAVSIAIVAPPPNVKTG